jgi:hypothetical protein
MSGGRAPGTNWIGGWVSPRTGLDDVEKRKFLTQPGLELRPLGRPTRSKVVKLKRINICQRVDRVILSELRLRSSLQHESNIDEL